MGKEFYPVGDTPLKISIYSAEKTDTTLHETGLLEIIFCIKGSVRFSYAYEEFTLHAGEFISVDKDAYYLYEGEDNVCVSFLIDLAEYEDIYPGITKMLFVCEGCRESSMRYPTVGHNMLKGIMIALLKQMKEAPAGKKSVNRTIVKNAADKLVNLFMTRFDICYYHAQNMEVSDEVLANIRKVTMYIYHHMSEKIVIGEIAELLNFSESYMSEYMRKYSVGFRNILNYARSNMSERLLLQTDKNILQISEECGFSDVKYYKSAFRQWYGTTPRQFRKQYGRRSCEKIRYLNITDIGEMIDAMMTEHYIETFLT